MRVLNKLIGIKIQKASNGAGMTLREGAEKYGKDHSTISSYETGRRSMNIERIERFCNVYGINYLDIMQEIYNEEKLKKSK